jgi:hypothetical protein
MVPAKLHETCTELLLTVPVKFQVPPTSTGALGVVLPPPQATRVVATTNADKASFTIVPSGGY